MTGSQDDDPRQHPSAAPRQRPSAAPRQRPSVAPRQRPSTAPRQRPSAAPRQRPSTAPRQRVVLAERRGARIVRTRVEVQQQTAVGDAMVRGLVRAQLGLALRVALTVVCLLGAVPLISHLLPGVAGVTILGVPLLWIGLGAGAYLLLFAFAWLYVRLAERNEQDFTDITDA